MRKLTIGLTLIVGLIVGGILLLPFIIDLNQYRDEYLPLLEQAVQRNISIQDLSLTVFPALGVRCQEVTIADDSTFSSKPFLEAPSLLLTIKWLPLFRGQIQIERLVVQEPRIQVIRSPSGVLNTATLGKGPSPNPDEPSQSSTPPFLALFGVEQLAIERGTFSFEDRAQDSTTSYSLDNFEFHTDSVQLGETAKIKLQGQLLPYQLPLEIEGQIGPLSLDLDIPRIEIDGALGKVKMHAQGQIEAGNLDLKIQAPTVSSEDIPVKLGLIRPVKITEFRARLHGPVLSQPGQAHAHTMKVDPLNFIMKLNDSIIKVSGQGTFSRVEVGGNAAALSSQDLPLALPLHQPLSLEQIRFEGAIQETKGELTSFEAKALNGSLRAQGGWEGTAPPSSFSLQGNFKRFDVEPLARALSTSSVRVVGVGNLEWRVRGETLIGGETWFTGPIYGAIHRGKIVGFDLIHVLEKALRMAGALGETTGVTEFSRLQAKTELHGKDLVINRLTVTAPAFSLEGEGKLGFDQSVNLQGKMALSAELSDKIIQQLPMVKVVRQKGRLVLPFFIEGTTQDPILQVDVRSLGNQLREKFQGRIEKVIEGDEQEIQKLLDEGKDLLKQLFPN